MSTIKETLKAQYRDKKLSEIEVIASNNLDQSVNNRRDFILALYYLQFTSRFRENKAYKNYTFETYINERFHLRLGTYNEKRWAFIKHKDASIKYGAGFVSKIKRECGAGNVKKVVAEIDTESKKVKKPLTRNKKDAITLKYALPKKEVPVKKSDSIWQSELDLAKSVIQDQNKLISDQTKQIKKLKMALEKYKQKYGDLLEATTPMFNIGENIRADIGMPV